MKILDILIVIVANNYENLSKAGIVQLSIFCILHFSSNREFSLQISHKYPNHLPISITGPDYYFDILVSVFHPIILQNSLLSETISTLIIILLNVSPHIKRIGNSASLKLFSIFEHFSLKKNLTKDTKMSQFLYQLLEVFNSRLQYQWDGSSYLIYAIISKKNIVDRLLELKFENLGETDVTEDWFNNFKINLPIGLILGMYNDLLPRIDRIVKKNSQISEAEIIEYLRKITMVGVFPVPHILYLRKFHSTQQTNHWLTSLIWGTIYTRNNNPQLFDSSTIKLFLVSSN